MSKDTGITSIKRLLNYDKQGPKNLTPKQARRNRKKNRKRLG